MNISICRNNVGIIDIAGPWEPGVLQLHPGMFYELPHDYCYCADKATIFMWEPFSFSFFSHCQLTNSTPVGNATPPRLGVRTHFPFFLLINILAQSRNGSQGTCITRKTVKTKLGLSPCYLRRWIERRGFLGWHLRLFLVPGKYIQIPN